MSRSHMWMLRGGTTDGDQAISLWQCRSCQLAASRTLMIPSSGGSRIGEPIVDDPCPALRADGGEEIPFEVGDRVVDRDADDPSPAQVVGLPDESAKNTVIEKLDQTVAEVNPDYPADDPVVAIKFVSPVDNRPEGTTYEYPASRLKPHTDETGASAGLTEGRFD